MHSLLRRHNFTSLLLAALFCAAATPAGSQVLGLIVPNGGERFRVGSATTIRWLNEGTASDTVRLDYSTDAGATWNLITDKATGRQHVWSRIPNTPSDRCLMRVSRSTVVGDSVLWLPATRPSSVIPDAVHFAEFSPNGSRVIGGGVEGDVFIWDSFTGAIIMRVPVETRANIPSPPGITLISCVHYSPDGTLFATTSPLPDSTGAMVRIFDAASGTKLREWRDVATTRFPSSETFTWSPDGTKILVVGQAGGRVYDAATGTKLVDLKGYVAPFVIASMVDGDWSSDGTRIIGVSTTGSTGIPDMVLSNPVTGDTIWTNTYPSSGSFSSVRFSRDGTRIITTAVIQPSNAGIVRIYDAATGALLIDKPTAFAEFATSGAFSHDGRFFAASGQDAGMPNWKLHLYDAASGTFVRQVGAIINGMRSLDFSPDDARILVACNDGVRIFRAAESTIGQNDVSDSLWSIYLDGNAVVTVGAPLVTAKQGAMIDVPISIDDAEGALGAGATRIDLELRYNATLLDPAGGTPRGTVSGGERIIQLSFPLAAAVDTVLATLRFRAALGNDSTTVLDIIGATSDNSNVTVLERDGLFRLSDLCYEGGARLLNPDGIVVLKVRAGGRGAGGIEAEVETIEEGPTSLWLCDINGRLLRNFIDDAIPPGRRVIPLDLEDIPQGRYFLLLRTPTVTATTPVEVVR